jgi:hypothetical protein
MHPKNSTLVVQIRVFAAASVDDVVVFELMVLWEVEQELVIRNGMHSRLLQMDRSLIADPSVLDVLGSRQLSSTGNKLVMSIDLPEKTY